MSRTPRLTSVICTYKRYDLLKSAVESLLQQTLEPSELEIIIVDNSPDLELATSKAQSLGGDPRVKYIIERTPGLSNARNVGCRAAAAPLIHYMDDDAIASPDLVARLIDAFDIFNAAVVGGRILPIFSVNRPAWLHDDLLGFVSVVDWGGTARLIRQGEWIAGANIAFQKTALEQAGLFSTSLGRVGSGHALLSNEEAEVVERIQVARGAVVYTPEASVRHLIEADRLTREWFRRRCAWQAASDYIKSPHVSMQQSQAAWDRVLRYISGLPAKYRNMHGLILDTDDPELFFRQIDALYNLTITTLSGFSRVDAYVHDG